MSRSDDTFTSAMQKLGVTRIDSSGKVDKPHVKPAPSNIRTRQGIASVLRESLSQNPEASIHQIENDEDLCKPGLAMRDFTRLKQGKFHREDSIHVRGYTVAEAIRQINDFLVSSIHAGYRCVKIVHGKGINSPNGISPIKLNTQGILARSNHVLAYCKAQPSDGGSGAKYVLLRKKRH